MRYGGHAQVWRRATLPGFAAKPQVQTRLPPSSFTDDELRDLDVICRIKTPVHGVPDLVNKFVFSWTALAFNDDGIGTFQGVSDKDVDNLPHQHTPPKSGTAQPEGCAGPNRSRMQRRVKEAASSNLRDRMSTHRNETATSVECWMSPKVKGAGPRGLRPRGQWCESLRSHPWEKPPARPVWGQGCGPR
jgi:hypothetical protein